jgi:hypothetical protein
MPVSSAPITVLERGWASHEEVEALPAALLAWAERPDAYLAALKPGGLGWKPREEREAVWPHHDYADRLVDKLGALHADREGR